MVSCIACELQTTCEAKQKANKKIRTISRHVHQELFEQVRLAMKTELFQQKLTERMWKMEGIISEAKQRHCLSKAKYRGLMKVQIQAYMVASVLNMKRIIAIFILVILCAHSLQFLRNSKFKYLYLFLDGGFSTAPLVFMDCIKFISFPLLSARST